MKSLWDFPICRDEWLYDPPPAAYPIRRRFASLSLRYGVTSQPPSGATSLYNHAQQIPKLRQQRHCIGRASVLASRLVGSLAPPNMPPLTGLFYFMTDVLQICRAYGAPLRESHRD